MKLGADPKEVGVVLAYICGEVLRCSYQGVLPTSSHTEFSLILNRTSPDLYCGSFQITYPLIPFSCFHVKRSSSETPGPLYTLP
jgi:hypothetical protein